MRRLIAALVIVAAGAVVVPAPAAVAKPLIGCEHRGFDHIKRHGGKLADDYYHRSHQERVTCDPDEHDKGIADKADDQEREHDDGPHIPHRDHPGFGCRWLHCG
ncbi:DUF7199 family protein [Mycobacterium avium]|uniref:DUF7199 family protein n=1 Tax=Mycobacterium avium TaxID=1764 RepID=UPI003AFAAA1A